MIFVLDSFTPLSVVILQLLHFCLSAVPRSAIGLIKLHSVILSLVGLRTRPCEVRVTLFYKAILSDGRCHVP
jgi:hypothetical protein